MEMNKALKARCFSQVKIKYPVNSGKLATCC